MSEVVHFGVAPPPPSVDYSRFIVRAYYRGARKLIQFVFVRIESTGEGEKKLRELREGGVSGFRVEGYIGEKGKGGGGCCFYLSISLLPFSTAGIFTQKVV